MQPQVATGFINGTGAAINVSLGFIPDHVRIVNLTDGDKIHENFLRKVAAFTSGGTTEVKPGDLIKGATSGATARVRQVILDSGTWAGGNAAGWILIEHEEFVGTFSNENIGVVNSVDETPGNDATLSAAFDQDGVDIDTEVAGTTTAATNIAAYLGSTTAGKGFTVGSTISEDGKLLGYIAVRNGPGIYP